VSMWYDEVNACGPFPGCRDGSRGVTGHFTALIWNGVREIGCTRNRFNIVACRYKGSDRLDCTTPNMGGSYNTNVFSPVKSRAECEELLRRCKAGDGGGGAAEEPPEEPPAEPAEQSSASAAQSQRAVEKAEKAAAKAEKAALKVREAAEEARHFAQSIEGLAAEAVRRADDAELFAAQAREAAGGGTSQGEWRSILAERTKCERLAGERPEPANSLSECQSRGDVQGRKYIIYEPDRKLCYSSPTCDEPMSTSFRWKIYEKQ